jgi:hypothetical protein
MTIFCFLLSSTGPPVDLVVIARQSTQIVCCFRGLALGGPEDQNDREREKKSGENIRRLACSPTWKKTVKHEKEKSEIKHDDDALIDFLDRAGKAWRKTSPRQFLCT